VLKTWTNKWDENPGFPWRLTLMAWNNKALGTKGKKQNAQQKASFQKN